MPRAKKSREYVFGELCWAKLGSYPWWPGQIADPQYCSEQVKKGARKGSYCVHFLESNSFSWVKPAELKPFRCAAYEEYSTKKLKFKGYTEAVALCQQREIDLGLVPPPGFVAEDAVKPSKVSKITMKSGGKTLGKRPRSSSSSAAGSPAGKRARIAQAEKLARVVPQMKTVVDLSDELAIYVKKAENDGDYDPVVTLLAIIGNLDVSAEMLRETPVGRRIKRLCKRPKYPASVKERAAALYAEYSEIIKKDYDLAKKAGLEPKGAKVVLKKKKVAKAEEPAARQVDLSLPAQAAAPAPAPAASSGPTKPRLVASDDEDTLEAPEEGTDTTMAEATA